MTLTDRIPCRLVMGFMMFSGVLVNYMMRVNLSVNIVAMAPVSTNQTVYENTLEWTSYERARVLSSYYWGYLAATLITGPVAEKFGVKIVMFITSLASATLTMLSVAAAKHSAMMMVINRLILGFFSGPLLPLLHVLISKWAVPEEKGKFIASLIGGTIGTVVSWSLCGVLIEHFGWEWGFYTFGIISFMWTVLWWFVVFDSPSEHPRISSHELIYLKDGVKLTGTKKRAAPYLRILTNVPIWSMLILNFGNTWGVYFVLTAAPNYLANVLGYKISSTGFLSSLLYLARCSMGFVFGSIGDFIIKRKCMSVLAVRKVGAVLSHIIPALLLLGLTLPETTAPVSVALLTISMGFNGAVTVSNTVNPHDLTNNFAGTVTGIATAIGTAAGIILPLVVASFTKNDETSAEAWKPVIYTGAAVYILSALQFLFFGSVKRQPWNEIAEEDESKTEKVESKYV